VPGQGIIIAERYRLNNEVAAGATGRVWCATDLLLRRRVAVKVLRRDYARDPARLPAFLAAASQAAAVSHRNVARVYDHGENGPDGAPYLVTEFIEGRALAEVIGGETVRASFIATALAQVADGLHAAHEAGLLHGDLKPTNILLQPGAARRATITDFGITHALGAIPRAGHTPGTVHGTGTVLYLAPERVSGGLGTPASDLYSLGIIACEWLTGTPPFTGTAQQVLAAHLRGSLPRLPATIPPGLAALATRLAAKDPGRRFEDAREVAVMARALAAELREDPADEVVRLPARLEKAPDLAAASPAAASGMAAADPAQPGRPRRVGPAQPGRPRRVGPAQPGRPRRVGPARPGPEAIRFRLSGLAAHKREVAWAASALVLAALMGWAPSAPVKSAVKVVQLAIPTTGHRAPAAGHVAAGLEHKGGGAGRYPAAGGNGDARQPGPSGSGPRSAGGQGPGEGAFGQGGRGWPASGLVPGSWSLSPAPLPGRSAGPGPQAPCPCGPTSPPSTPASPGSATSHPVPGTGPRPSSAPASPPPALPVPLPTAPLPIPTISVSVPPLMAPSAATPAPPLPTPTIPASGTSPTLPISV